MNIRFAGRLSLREEFAMLKLFYSPGACSIVTHIALEEAEAEFEPVRVTLAQGEHLRPEYLAVNPHAGVPALATDGGVITENIAILNLIADLYEAPGSVPRDEPVAAARCNELLGWFASSVHISLPTSGAVSGSPMIRPFGPRSRTMGSRRSESSSQKSSSGRAKTGLSMAASPPQTATR